MAFLLEHLPPQVHLVLATRADPPLPLAAAAGARRAGRGPRGRPALHPGGSRRVPRRADGPGAVARRTSPRWPSGPRDGSAALQLAALVAAGPRRPRRGHRQVRRRRPLRRRLPRRGGPRPPAHRRARLPAARRRSSSGSPARCATPSPARPAARRGWSRSSGPTCSSSRSTTTGSGTATTTCSPTCCARSCSRQQPGRVAELHRRASAWFAGRRRPGRGHQARAGRRRLRPGRRPHRARHAGDAPRTTGGRARSLGAASCPTRWCGSGRCSRVAFVGALAQVSDFATVDERLSRHRASLRPRRRPLAGAAAAGPGRRRRGRLPVASRGRRDVPGRARARARRPRRAPSTHAARPCRWLRRATT